MSDDIGTLQDSTVIAFQISFLQLHGVSILFELLLNPLGTQFMCLTIHRARTEGTLGSTERKS